MSASPSEKAEGSAKKATTTSRKRKREDSERDGDDGLEVVGTIVPAPTTGRGAGSLLRILASWSNKLITVPPGRISKNTLNFLKKLQDPKCNDREW
jgi:hypothetical protein